MRAWPLVVLLLAGCVQPAAPVEDAAPPEATTLRFPVVSRAGGPMEVAATAWGPADAATVLLAVHGSGGAAAASWGPLASTPHTLAQRQAPLGRLVVAVELPGYGRSEARSEAYGIEDHAFVVDQVADQLRARHGTVLGAGHSMGGLIVGLAQALHESFDAVLVLAMTHGAFSDEANACFQRGDCPEDVAVRCCFFEPEMDPLVLAEVADAFEPMPPANGWGIALWTGNGPGGAGLDDVTRRVQVPVLVLFGEEDWFYDASDYPDERAHWGSDDVTVTTYPRTGHFLLHHRNAPAVLADVEAWLAARGY